MNLFTIAFFILGTILFIIAGINYLIAPKYDKAKHLIGILIAIITMVITGCYIYQSVQS